MIPASIGASIFTPAGSTQPGDVAGGGDSFADILATLEAAVTQDGTAIGDPSAAASSASSLVPTVTTPAITPAAAVTPVAGPAVTPDAGVAPDATADAGSANDIIPATTVPAAAPQGKPQTPFAFGKDAPKAKAQSDDAKPAPATAQPAANDNAAALQPMLPPVTPPPVQPQTAAQAPSQTDNTTPIAAAGPATPATAPQATAPQATAPQASVPQSGAAANMPGQAANDTDDDVTDVAAQTTAQAGVPAQADKAGPKAAAAKTAKPDVKKAVDDTKAAAAKPDTAPAQASSPSTGNDTKQAEAKPDANQNDTAGGNAQANTPAPTHASANAQPQDASLAVNAPAAAPAHAATTNDAAGASNLAQAPSQPHHAPNVGSLAVEIAAKSQSGAKQFDIRLDPPELGRVEVRLSIDASGKAQAHLTADQPQTLDLLRKDSTSLTQALRDAGLNVSQDGLNFSLRQQQSHAGQDQQQQNQAQGGRVWRGNLAAPATNETASAAATSRSGTGLLDIKV